MTLKKALIFGLATLIDLSLANGGPACTFVPGSPVHTTSGKVYGHRAPNATQVSEYLGIPFAQPPLGNLRFAPPVKYEGHGKVSGANYGHDCPSPSAGGKNIPANFGGLLSEFNQHEDCLYLNVWSKPQVGTTSKPVLVYIYGGGFSGGGTNATSSSGQFWVDTDDIVFVNFNYRVNIFGFPGAPDLTKNVGLLDQRLAIEWVRDNIAAFGGDPERITIFGESAGATSVDYYTYTWLEDPIIKGAIAQSGSANNFGNKLPSTASDAWYQTASKVGCGDNTTAADKVLTCMRSKNTTMEDLITAEFAIIPPSRGFLGAVFGSAGPTIDNKIVFSDYNTLAEQQKFLKIPTIYGTNDYEAGSFILIADSINQTLPESYWNEFDLTEFTCPIQTAAQFRSAAGLPSWLYRNFAMFPNLEIPTSIGRAYHGSELLSMFGTSDQVTGQPSTWQEREFGAYVRGAWSAFARCPHDGLVPYGWPKYSNTTNSLVQLAWNNITNVAALNTSAAYDQGCGPFPYPGVLNM